MVALQTWRQSRRRFWDFKTRCRMGGCSIWTAWIRERWHGLHVEGTWFRLFCGWPGWLGRGLLWLLDFRFFIFPDKAFTNLQSRAKLGAYLQDLKRRGFKANIHLYKWYALVRLM
jgi:hypothetical protein